MLAEDTPQHQKDAIEEELIADGLRSANDPRARDVLQATLAAARARGHQAYRKHAADRSCRLMAKKSKPSVNRLVGAEPARSIARDAPLPRRGRCPHPAARRRDQGRRLAHEGREGAGDKAGERPEENLQVTEGVTMFRNRMLGGVSFLPLFAPEGAAGGAEVDPAEVAAHGDPEFAEAPLAPLRKARKRAAGEGEAETPKALLLRRCGRCRRWRRRGRRQARARRRRAAAENRQGADQAARHRRR
jgi:hypothetical protein